jgi:hypothetical protein
MGDITPLFQPGRNLTGKVTATAVVGGRFVMQAATKASNEAIPVKYPTGNTVPVLGVTHGDGAVGDYVDILGPGHVVPVEVGTGGVTYGTPVAVDTAGKVVASSAGATTVGLCLQTASAGAFAYVRVGDGHISIGA